MIHNLHPSTVQFLIFLLGAATLHGLYLSILLFFKNDKDWPHRLLAGTVLIFSLFLFNYLLFLTKIIVEWPNLMGVFTAPFYLAGAGFYFFVKSALNRSFQWKWVYLWHSLPFVYGCWRSIQVFQISTVRKLEYIEQLLGNEIPDFSSIQFLWGTMTSWILLVYAIAALRLCQKQIKNAVNAENFKRVHWLKNFCFGFISLISLDILVKAAAFLMQWPAAGMEYILAALLAIAIHIVGYFAMGGLPKWKIKEKKYKTSALTTPQIATYQNQLLELMETKQPWLQADLKIGDLAKMLGVPSHQLSQILNEGLQTKFSTLMNHYRVEEVKRRLIHPKYQHYSILAIALDCGFSNKATFNRVFKQLVGLTPSAYMKTLQS